MNEYLAAYITGVLILIIMYGFYDLWYPELDNVNVPVWAALLVSAAWPVALVAITAFHVYIFLDRTSPRRTLPRQRK